MVLNKSSLLNTIRFPVPALYPTVVSLPTAIFVIPLNLPFLTLFTLTLLITPSLPSLGPPTCLNKSTLL